MCLCEFVICILCACVCASYRNCSCVYVGLFVCVFICWHDFVDLCVAVHVDWTLRTTRVNVTSGCVGCRVSAYFS
jgi:hypothetical protein